MPSSRHPLRLLRWTFVFFPALLGAQGLPSGRPEQLGFSGDGLARVTSVVQAYVDSGLIAGAAFVVVRNGQIAWRGTSGFMDLEASTPMRPDALFRICSMTKPITAAAAMQLVEQGKLALDAPVSKYLPAFAEAKVYAGGPSSAPTLRDAARPIRVEDLMLHTAGLGFRLPNHDQAIDSLWAMSDLLVWERSLADFADAVARRPLFFSPGDQWQYGLGLEVLGRVIEVVSGKSFDDYLQDELFAPLGMSHTGFVFPEAARDRIVTLYDRSGPEKQLHRSGDTTCGTHTTDTRYFSGGGGLVSTMDDYLRFAQMLLNGGELDGRRVLARESVGRIMQNHLPERLVPLPLPSFLGRPGQPGYGQGYGGAVLVDAAATPIPGPVGIYRWLGYYSTNFWVDPRNQVIGMVWAQFRPDGDTTLGLDPAFQRAVYEAMIKF
jgi:CubicO group peptidase (beta-lactamase class C family)